MNKFTASKLDKVTLNIGAGEAGQKLANAKDLLSKVTGKNPVITRARKRNPSFKVRKGDEIGVKVTLRGKTALDVLKRGLESIDNVLKERSFDLGGNVSFGIKEYIDFPGMKYDPKIGMMGFDICVTLSKAGKRISVRKINARRLPLKQRVSRNEAMEFFKALGVKLMTKAEEEEAY